MSPLRAMSVLGSIIAFPGRALAGLYDVLPATKQIRASIQRRHIGVGETLAAFAFWSLLIPLAVSFVPGTADTEHWADFRVTNTESSDSPRRVVSAEARMPAEPTPAPATQPLVAQRATGAAQHLAPANLTENVETRTEIPVPAAKPRVESQPSPERQPAADRKYAPRNEAQRATRVRQQSAIRCPRPGDFPVRDRWTGLWFCVRR